MSTTPDPREAIADEERESAYREAAIHFFSLLEACIAHACNAQTVTIGMLQLKYALGFACESMSDAAAKHGISPQCISKGAREFIRENNLPIPLGMESEASSKAHRDARVKQLRPKTQTK
jgi:hypothetical protein